MQKVKVQRYISGKRPEYAQYVSTDDETDDEDFIDRKTQKPYDRGEAASHDQFANIQYHQNELQEDSRLRRLEQVRRDVGIATDRHERHRHIHEPEIVQSEDEDEEDEIEPPASAYGEDGFEAPEPPSINGEESASALRNRRIALGSDSETDTELSDTEIELRRQKLRSKMLQQRKEEEVLLKEEEKQSESSDSESSEYEEETESEEENEPRLKPLFVRKRDRATIAEKEKEAAKQRQIEHEAKKMAKERRRQTLRLVEDSVKKDLEKMKVNNVLSFKQSNRLILTNSYSYFSPKEANLILMMFARMTIMTKSSMKLGSCVSLSALNAIARRKNSKFCKSFKNSIDFSISFLFVFLDKNVSDSR